MTDDLREHQDDDPREPPAEDSRRSRDDFGGPKRRLPEPGGAGDERTG